LGLCGESYGVTTTEHRTGFDDATGRFKKSTSRNREMGNGWLPARFRPFCSPRLLQNEAGKTLTARMRPEIVQFSQRVVYFPN